MAPLILRSQHLAVALCYHWEGARLELDAGFWLLPLRRLADMPGLTSAVAAGVFLIGFLVAWALAVMSFRRATWSSRGYWLSLFAIFPVLQIPAMAVLAVLPRAQAAGEDLEARRIDLVDVLQGIIAGIGLIVAAVLVSAFTLDAYGWGVFVSTPLQSPRPAPLRLCRDWRHAVHPQIDGFVSTKLSIQRPFAASLIRSLPLCGRKYSTARLA